MIKQKIIPFNEKYIFVLSEEFNIDFKHPVSDYFFKLDDLSINLLISLKWVIWGYKFLHNLSNEIKIFPEINLEDIMEKTIQPQINIEKKDHLITIDNHVISNLLDLENLLGTFYNNNVFSENTKVHMKLKLNLNEFLALNFLYKPGFTTYTQIF